ncbi:TWiK family of potassium channels protein 18 isoform X1 [Eurytemora carolleeae]|uniref:TWiK family of potassium channels protein 18 isoform X1 n=1 Tax=Eurytemora carolleeae TaxID=1294199 RepID=UPI000C767ADA|nr:TWiK family of potassium channels protein 18 isoform X1 [Eurytemora carolleeae]XP_023335415.1 TWiK family of potassium channels protein 18 isoform X1 [Eurytemora carolleeae]|eukprot:XP_023335414.1 TWiK family of potassium channels protein 18-like isoform X1 [Eurytemora affinis]
MERSRSIKSRSTYVGSLGGTSVRSKNSSASSEDKTKVVKDCCRSVVEFLFTQVGVGALVVSYTIVGAIAFQAIETQNKEDLIKEVEESRKRIVEDLWNITSMFNVLYSSTWERHIQIKLLEHQKSMVGYIQSGYDELRVEDRWTFPAALMFTLSVITMIGYGNMVPRTDWGKIATIIYAIIGIPVYFLYFMNMGKVFANCFKWIYRRIHGCTVRKQIDYSTMEDDEVFKQEQIMIPSTACIWVLLVYLFTGTIMFAEWEGWNYLDSVYFCVTSLCKIGLGDFVPGTNFAGETEKMNKAKLIINFVYLLVGMGVIAMNYYLLKEEVVLRIERMKRKVTEYCRYRDK